MRHDESVNVNKPDDLGIADHIPHDGPFCFLDERSGFVVRVGLGLAEDEEE
jgi:hypothetical protein